MDPQHIAVLDDDPDITELLGNYLRGQGFRVSETHKGAALMALMAEDTPDLVLLDLGLPGEDGFAIARRLREHWQCGLVIVTGRGDAVDKIVGLEIGADDYVTKPFDLRELLARIKAVLRRTLGHAPVAARATMAPVGTGGTLPAAAAAAGVAPPAERCRFAGWVLDLGARRLHGPDGAEVALTNGEFELLAVFAAHPGRVLSRDFVLENTRGREAGPFDRTVDVQIGRLRRKIETDPQEPQILKSVRGAGYILVAPVTRE